MCVFLSASVSSITDLSAFKVHPVELLQEMRNRWISNSEYLVVFFCVNLTETGLLRAESDHGAVGD